MKKNLTSKSVVFGTVGKKHFAFLVNLFKIVKITLKDNEFFDLYYNKKKTLSEIKFLLEGNYSETHEEIFDKLEKRIHFVENEAKNYIDNSKVKELFFGNIILFDREREPISKKNIFEKLKVAKEERKFGITLLGFRDTDIFTHSNIKDIAEYCRENDISIEVISKTNTLPKYEILKMFENVNTKMVIRTIGETNEFTTEEFLSSLFYFGMCKIKLFIELNKYHEEFKEIQEYCLKFKIPTTTVFYEKDWYPTPI